MSIIDKVISVCQNAEGQESRSAMGKFHRDVLLVHEVAEG